MSVFFLKVEWYLDHDNKKKVLFVFLNKITVHAHGMQIVRKQ